MLDTLVENKDMALLQYSVWNRCTAITVSATDYIPQPSAHQCPLTDPMQC